MKQSVSADKYNIAWFKLAEYVSRGEKERALGIYRLLSHSIDDQAFARQLEGDILWSFNDSSAADKYYQAAQLYKKDQRELQAAAIYEHLIVLDPHSIVYLQHLVELYANLQIKQKIILYGMRLFDQLLLTKDAVQAQWLLNLFEQNNLEQPEFYERLLWLLIRADNIDVALIENYIKKTLFEYTQIGDTLAIEQLIELLKACDIKYADLAISFLENKKKELT
jgi:hypothetical protein